jgi:acyl carrier protein
MSPSESAAATTRPTPTEAEIRHWLIRRVAHTAGVPEAEIDIAAPFADYGLNSRQAVGLSGDLETWMKRELDPTLVWDHPSIERLAKFLAEEVAPAD